MTRKTTKTSHTKTQPAFSLSPSNWLQLGLIIFVLILIFASSQKEIIKPSDAATDSNVIGTQLGPNSYISSSTTLDEALPKGWSILESTDPKTYAHGRIVIATDNQGNYYSINSQPSCGYRGFFGGRIQTCKWSNRIIKMPTKQTLFEVFPSLDPNFYNQDETTISKPDLPNADTTISQPTPPTDTLTQPPTLDGLNQSPVAGKTSWWSRLKAWFTSSRGRSDGNSTTGKEQTIAQKQLAKYTPWYCRIFRNLASCRALLNPPNLSTEKFLNEEGSRVTTASHAFANIFHSRASGARDSFGDATIQTAMDEGILGRDLKTNDPLYLPYQDPNYEPVFYYRCGPFDFVGTLDQVAQECDDAPNAPDGFPAFNINDGNHKNDGYIFDPKQAIKLDIQTSNRKDFVDGQPPFVFKFGDYVYGDDDPRITYLAYVKALDANATMAGETTKTKLTQLNPASGGPETSPKYSIQFRNTTMPENVVSAYQNGTWRGEWIRYGGHDIRKVFDIEITPKIDDESPLLYARYGDTIRYYTRYNLDAQIASQPIFPYNVEMSHEDLDKLPVVTTEEIASNILDSLFNPSPDPSLVGNLNQQLMQGLLYTDSSGVQPIKKLAGLLIMPHRRIYEYQAQFLGGYAHRVDYFIVREGDTGAMKLGEGSTAFTPSKFATYGYLLMEPDTSEHTITCTDPTAGVGLTDYFERLRVQQYECTPRKHSALYKSYVDESIKTRL